MKAKQWLSVATMASALAIAGTAAAHGDKGQVSKQEQAGAAVNSNAPAQLGSDLNGNSAAQLGTSTSKTTVPNEAEAVEGANPTTANRQPLIEQNPSTDTTNAAPARTGSDVRPTDMGPANTRGK
jgi:hypothetical protein